MKLLTWASLAIGILITANLSAKEIGVEVTDIQDPMVPCYCKNAGDIGKICITTTKWAHDDLPRENDDYLTEFVPSVVGNEFILESNAYYMQCGFDVTPFIFTDPNLQTPYNGLRMFRFHGFKGAMPLMRVSITNPRGQLIQSPLIGGAFSQIDAYYKKGQPDEVRMVQHPGKVVYKVLLEKVLTDFQIRMILDDGHQEVKYVKAILAVNPGGNGGLKAFGEYTVKLRFFRKPGIPITHRWDTKAIGIEVLSL